MRNSESNNNNLEVEVPKFKLVFEKPKTFQTALVICVINEGHRILNQLKEISAAGLQIDVVVCDGGSTDGTQKIITGRDFGVTALLEKDEPGGLSSQLRIAFSYCLENQYINVVTMDGNNKDGIDGIERIVSALEHGYDFVQGSRFIRDGLAVNTPKLRYLAIRLIHAPIISLAAGFKFTDTTNGFRGFSSELLTQKKLRIFRREFMHYELLANIPVLAVRSGFKATEVPVRRSYPSSGKIPTKIQGLSGNLSIMKTLIKTFTHRFEI